MSRSVGGILLEQFADQRRYTGKGSDLRICLLALSGDVPQPSSLGRAIGVRPVSVSLRLSRQDVHSPGVHRPLRPALKAAPGAGGSHHR